MVDRMLFLKGKEAIHLFSFFMWRSFRMKRLLVVFFLASFTNLIFAADPDLDTLLRQAAELRKAGKPQEARPLAEQAAALAEKRQDWPHLWSARQELSFGYRIAG